MFCQIWNRNDLQVPWGPPLCPGKVRWEKCRQFRRGSFRESGGSTSQWDVLGYVKGGYCTPVDSLGSGYRNFTWRCSQGDRHKLQGESSWNFSWSRGNSSRCRQTRPSPRGEEDRLWRGDEWSLSNQDVSWARVWFPLYLLQGASKGGKGLKVGALSPLCL